MTQAGGEDTISKLFQNSIRPVKPKEKLLEENDDAKSATSDSSEEDENIAEAVQEQTNEMDIDNESEQSSSADEDDFETEHEKAAHTIFLGNVPVSVLKSKSSHKALIEHIGGRELVKSIRFRSIAFKSSLPRKAAVMEVGNLHPKRDTLNAYVVLRDSTDQIIKQLNGSLFEDHHLRCDSILHPSEKSASKSVFIGNLSYATQEEELYSHFKKCGDIDYVRIVRDKKTNIGKGFAYVQFKEKEAVEHALLLNDKEFKAQQSQKVRKLRVARSKSTKTLKKDRNIKISQADKSSKREVLRNQQRDRNDRAFGRAAAANMKKEDALRRKSGVVEGERAIKGSNDVEKLMKSIQKKKAKKPRIGRERSRNWKGKGADRLKK